MKHQTPEIVSGIGQGKKKQTRSDEGSEAGEDISDGTCCDMHHSVSH